MSATGRWPAARVALLGAALIAAFVGGYLLRGPGGEPAAPGAGPATPGAEAHETPGQVQFWTCSMHPQIRLPGPGKCTICGMDLIPVSATHASQAGSARLVLSEEARRLARVRTVPVERRSATVEVRMVGKVDYDETRIRDITSWVAGRLERLFVDYTGVAVTRGDHMVDIYSPELVAAQEELLQAIAARDALAKSDLEIMRRTAAETVTAARERLRLWGLLPEQIDALESRGTAQDLVTIYSPMTGVVINKHVKEGAYVDTGTRIYTIADLSHLWVRLEAYESDMEWLHLGQAVEFSAEAYPGSVFQGRVSFIEPVIDPRTRTVKLRVNVANDNLRLKPEMLVRAVVKARLAGAGQVFDPYLAGKWICPMHPEVVKPGAGVCDICGMPLVPAESLGFARRPPSEQQPLVIPSTAPLITGTRAVVYVEVPGTERPTYEGREVQLGPRAGDVYIVRSGLSEGEQVVVEGNFAIDSALQIEAKPSMMSPTEGTHSAGHDHAADPSSAGAAPSAGAASLRPDRGAAPGPARRLTPFYAAYLDLQRSLANDDEAAARKALAAIDAVLTELGAGGAGAPRQTAWVETLPRIHAAVTAAHNAGDLAALRRAFGDLSTAVIELARRVGQATGEPLKVVFCPMALDGGASWMQQGDAVRNPYYGASMLGCGEVASTLPSLGTDGR